MRLVIDLQSCQGGSRLRGIGRYSLALARAMVAQHRSDDVFVMLGDLIPNGETALRQHLSDLLPESHMLTVSLLPSTAYSDGPESWRMHVNACLREHFLAMMQPDVVHIASMFEGIAEDIVTSIDKLGDGPVVASTLYDLIPLMRPDQYLPLPKHRKWYAAKIANLRRADVLLSISASARNEAIDLLGIDPNDVVNISTAANDYFQPVNTTAAVKQHFLDSLKITKPFFLYAANVEPRKNFKGLIEAFGLLAAEVREQHQLVMVCAPDHAGRAELQKLAKSAGLGPQDYVITGHLADEQLRLIYSLCHLFVYPSFHEGFGLPVLEAMQCGAAAIGSNTTSIPEIIERSDALFDPKRPREIAVLMARSVTDPDYLADLRRYGPARAATFSWDRSARAALDALAESVRRKQDRRAADVTKRSAYDLFIAACAPYLSARSPHDAAAVARVAAQNLKTLEAFASPTHSSIRSRLA